MKWFAFLPEGSTQHVLVNGKTYESAKKRLTRWSKSSKVVLSNMQVLNEGKGYDNFAEAWHYHPQFTMVHSGF